MARAEHRTNFQLSIWKEEFSKLKFSETDFFLVESIAHTDRYFKTRGTCVCGHPYNGPSQHGTSHWLKKCSQCGRVFVNFRTRGLPAPKEGWVVTGKMQMLSQLPRPEGRGLQPQSPVKATTLTPW